MFHKTLCISIGAQFLEQPPAGRMFVPVNDQITFSCSVDNGFVVDWAITFPGSNVSRSASDSIDLRIIEQRNVSLMEVSTSSSSLSFSILDESGTPANNATTITCIAAMLGMVERDPGNEVEVIFYGEFHCLI